jgi:hypothetical protein
LSRISSDVCFVFPRTGQRLWASEAFLVQASPFFKQILSSEFVEGSSSSPRAQTAASSSSKSQPFDAYSFEESDEETDVLEVKKRPSKQSASTESHKTITVTDSAYSTYFALLLWLQSRHISFAPLVSTYRSDGKSRASAFSAHSLSNLASISSSSDLLPPPVSPRSVYRLAHFLEINELADLALSDFRSQLRPETVAYELYSDVSSAYSTVRDIALDYTVDHWKVVKESPALKDIEGKVLEGGFAGEEDVKIAGTAMLLARKLYESRR